MLNVYYTQNYARLVETVMTLYVEKHGDRTAEKFTRRTFIART
jgi:hypothetical protein